MAVSVRDIRDSDDDGEDFDFDDASPAAPVTVAAPAPAPPVAAATTAGSGGGGGSDTILTPKRAAAADTLVRAAGAVAHAEVAEAMQPTENVVASHKGDVNGPAVVRMLNDQFRYLSLNREIRSFKTLETCDVAALYISEIVETFCDKYGIAMPPLDATATATGFAAMYVLLDFAAPPPLPPPPPPPARATDLCVRRKQTG